MTSDLDKPLFIGI